MSLDYKRNGQSFTLNNLGKTSNCAFFG